MNKMDEVAQGLLRPINPTLILILGIYTVVWGLWLIAPWWTVFTQAALYAQMHALAAEWVWGLFAVGTGLLTLRGAYKPSYTNLHIGAFAAALFWLVIGLMYFAGDWTNTGGITALCFFTYSAVVWVNVKINKHFYDKNVR